MCKSYLTNIIRITSVLLLIGLFITSCDSFSDFGDMNTNPTTADQVEPAMKLTTLQLATAGTRYEMWRAQLLYGENVSQHLVNAFYGGGNNYTESIDWLTAFWNTAYSGNEISERAQVKGVENLIHQLKQKEEAGESVNNMLGIARIMRVFIYHRITDLYGDIPYSEAGKGYIEREFTPVYDKQEEIYNDFFSELDAAVNQLDPSGSSYGGNDLMYNGDVAKWQRFANSLRLRLALRLVKVDITKAENQAVAAINAPGGVMTSNDDIAMVKHQDGPSNGPAGMNSNPISEAMNDGGDHEFVAQTLVDWMKNANDPRLEVYAETDSSAYVGFPSGYTSTSVQNHPSFNATTNNYARVNSMLIDREDPTFFQTYAEVEFMLAEVAARGWTAGNAQDHYEAGVEAAMNYLSLYDANGGANISSGDISNYLANNPYNASGTLDQQLEQINSQYWAAVFLNGIEAWSNFRRSGYPDLEPALVDSNDPPPGNQTDGQIPRRLTYPEGNESILNAKNYNEVIKRQGDNNMVTRVWWDKQ
ncbi:SusD/RagB family nutrient-binding outer membrane lipoprotein [Fodinibius halophilus]|uniref:SusD/RagB family nutrient-binding outer membrane lipoprotein n=1 Tax=Fodinibius halophilus TaxID=1736908 RepID=A0A6M1T6U4_9BACT|nr:SusD/RagB family nutrient-binding outer membrane lipoprotein [Fodinibius halophilus]NGP88363.1 SusD/RagB family nutrient-binding outer membrane lipoprotein [Fodinibius halophilus]